MARRSREKRRIRPWVVILVILVLLFLLRAPILKGVGSFLVTEDFLTSADIIFLLNGSVDVRPFLAATLWKEGLAPVIVIAARKPSRTVELGLQPNLTEISVGVLRESGVPEENIEVLAGEVTNTREEARALRGYVEENRIKEVIVVTSDFQTRRTEWNIERELTGLGVAIQMAAASEPYYGPDNWWQHEQGVIDVFEEYVRVLFYLIE